MAYLNGLIPSANRIGLRTAPGQQLVGGAAPACDALSDAVYAKYGWRPELTDSYRPLEVQERIFRERYRVQLFGSGKYGDVRWWKGLRWVRFTGPAAAVPGTSNHGDGEAVDVTALGGFYGQRYKELASLAAEYGWDNREGASIGEAWHWTFNGTGGALADVIAARPPIAIPTPIIPTRTEADDMEFRIRVDATTSGVKNADAHTIFLCRFGPPGTACFRALSPTDNANLERAGIPLRKVVDGNGARDFSQYEKDTMRASIISVSQNWGVQ